MDFWGIGGVVCSGVSARTEGGGGGGGDNAGGGGGGRSGEGVAVAKVAAKLGTLAGGCSS